MCAGLRLVRPWPPYTVDGCLASFGGSSASREAVVCVTGTGQAELRDLVGYWPDSGSVQSPVITKEFVSSTN